MTLSLVIEILVAILLMVAIGYCSILNSRLKRLRSDEEALRATIGELVTATEIAERAILGLKATAIECDKSLSERLTLAERLASTLKGGVLDGEDVLLRIKRITVAARSQSALDDVPDQPVPASRYQYAAAASSERLLSHRMRKGNTI